MRLNYNNKFKDKHPEETVEIIRNYFNSLGLVTKVTNMIEAQSSTWYCRIELKHNNRVLFGQNGKGISKEYCLASGYGELYERFCSKYTYMNPFLTQKVMDKHYELKNYYFHPEERIIDFHTAFSATQAGLDCLDIFNVDNSFEHYINSILNNIYVGVPFHSTYSDDIKYMEPRLSLYLHGSSGLSCGNSFYEAFNQGMSEIYEHEVTRFYIEGNPHPCYYTLDLNKVVNEKLKNIITKIQEYNYLYIFDLSYNYNLPVLMSLIVNKITHAISINFGSFPVFEIAFERILTELYQGFESFDDEKINGQFPWRTHTFENMQDARNTAETTNIFAVEELLLRAITVEQPSNTFLYGEFSNEDIYNYMLQLNTANNFNIYYYNHSSLPDMYVLELIDISGPQRLVDLKTMKSRLDRAQVIKIINMLQESYDLGYKYIHNKDFNLQEFLSFGERNGALSFYEHYTYRYLSFNWMSIVMPDPITAKDLFNLSEIITKNKSKLLAAYDETLPYFYANPSMYQVLITYATMYRYAAANYTVEELLNIFNALHLNYNEEDIIELTNDNYWLEKIILADIQNVFTPEYQNYVNILANSY